jgi:hypothetical protein
MMHNGFLVLAGRKSCDEWTLKVVDRGSNIGYPSMFTIQPGAGL